MFPRSHADQLDPAVQAELDALEAALGDAVRDERPAPRPEWSEMLDARVAEGFSAARTPRRVVRLRARVLVPVVGVLAAMVLAFAVVVPHLSSSGGGLAPGATPSAES